MNDSKTPAPDSQHPQAKAIGKNKFNKQKKSPAVALENSSPAPSVVVPAPSAPVAAAPSSTPAVAAPKPPGRNSPTPFGTGFAAPGKDQSFFELAIKLVGSDDPPFVVEVPLTGNGFLDKGNAISVARKKFPGREMTIVTSRIYVKTENALSEISPGATLASLFGASGEITSDLIEVGRAVYDCRRGAIFLRNMRSHIGLAFRPSDGGLIVFSNRIVSNRLASELPLIVAEILGNGAREIEIYLKP